MLSTDTIWGVASPDSAISQRANLDFGLRRAMLHYAELSVPGIGGIFFVRQLLWPCLALWVQAEGTGRRISTVRIANGIEALASKTWLYFNPGASPETHQGRVAGLRILPHRGWMFKDLGAAGGYVTNPLRRAASRALPVDGGLGFSDGGAILSRMALTTNVGEIFAQTALEEKIAQGGKTLGPWLRDWVNSNLNLPPQPGDAMLANLLKAIGPFKPTKEQRKIVLGRLLLDDCSKPKGMQDTGRRRRLVEVIQKHSRAGIRNFDNQVLNSLMKAGKDGQEHVTALRTARAFRQMLDAAVVVVRVCLLHSNSSLVLAALAEDTDIAAKLNLLRSATSEFLQISKGDVLLQHQDAKAFAGGVSEDDLPLALRTLIQRDARILLLDETQERVMRGSAFRSDRLDWNDPEADASSGELYLGQKKLPPRIGNLCSLLEDCGGL
jgi:hypothetical protein